MKKIILFPIIICLVFLIAPSVLAASGYVDGVLVSTVNCESPPASTYLNIGKCNTPSYFTAGQQVWHCIKLITPVGGGPITAYFYIDGQQKPSNSFPAYPAPQQYQIRCDYYKTYTDSDVGIHTFKGEVSTCGGGACSKSVNFEVKASAQPKLSITDFYLKDSSGNKKTTFKVGDSIKPCIMVNNAGNKDGTFDMKYTVGPYQDSIPKSISANAWTESCGWSYTISTKGTYTYSVDISPNCVSSCSKSMSFIVEEVCTPKTWYYDGDEDGYGISSDTKSACPSDPPDGYASKSGDCDDGKIFIYPNAPELCNTYDDDCDGTKNDGVEKYIACGINGNGQQKQICDLNAQWVNSGTCSDSDICTNGQTKQCGTTDVGECSYGIVTCANGNFNGQCVGEVKSTNEICDNKDNNCDGSKDESLEKFVICGINNNGQQKQICSSGGWVNSGTCSDNSVCTNGQTKQCGTTDVGECSYGIVTCANGNFNGQCVGEVKSTSEICDNKDNNCDGSKDEGLVCNTNENCGSYGNPCADDYTCVSGTCQWTSNNHFIIYNAPTQEVKDKALEYLEQSYALLTASFDKNVLWSAPIIVNFVGKDPSDDIFEKNAWFNGVYGLAGIGIEIYYPTDYQSKQNQEPNKFNYDLQIALSHEFTHLLMQKVGGPYTSEGLADWGTYAVFSLDSHDYLNSYKWALCDQNVAEFPVENYFAYEEETSKNIKRSMARDLYIELFGKDASMFKSYIYVYQAGIGDENNKRKGAITSMYISKYFDFSKNYEQVIEFLFPCPDAIVLEKEDYIKLYTELKKANLISSMSYYSTENIAQPVMNTQNEYISSMSDTPTPITPKIKKQLSLMGLGTKELLTKKNIQALKVNIKNEDEINKIINDIYKTKDEGTVDSVLFWGKKEAVKKLDGLNVQKLPGILKIAGFALYFSYKFEECGEPITAIVYGAIDAAKGALLAPVEGSALIIWGGTTVEKMVACPDTNTPECEYIKKTNEYTEFYLDITEKTLGQCLNLPKYACVPSYQGQVCYTPNTINPLNIEQITIKDDEDVSFNVKLINNANSWEYSYQHPTGLGYIFTQIYKDYSYFYLDASIINKETEEHLKDYSTKTVDLVDLAPKFGEPLNKEKTIPFEATKVSKNKEYLFKADIWWCGDKNFAKPGKYNACEQVGEISKPFTLENQLPIINSVTCNSISYLTVPCPVFSTKDPDPNEEKVFGNKIDILAGDKLTMTLTAHDVDGNYLEVSYSGDYTSQFKNIGCVDTNDGATGKICTFTFTPTQNDVGKSNYHVNFVVKDGTEQIIETYSFNIKENSPKIISPKLTDSNKGVTQSQEPLFEWYNIAGGTPIKYFIRIYNSFSSEEPVFASKYVDQTVSTTETSYKMGDHAGDIKLNKDNEYWWKVTAFSQYDVELNSTKEKFYVDCWTDVQCVINEPSVFTCENGAVQEEKKVGYCKQDNLLLTEFPYCTSKTEKTKQDCPYGCNDGACLPKQDDVACYNDDECPQKTENYCLGNDIYTKTTGACIDDGSPAAHCDNNAYPIYPVDGTPKLVTKCATDEICSNAQCIPNPALIVCNNDNDCSSKTDYFCSEDNKKVDYSVHNGLCMNAGKTNSYCDYYPSTPPETSKVCGAGEICSDGACTPKPADPDTDTDGVPDKTDNCILVKNPDQKDYDLDGKGDACDDDDDNDAVPDNKDNCVLTKNFDQKDNDADGKGDACDDDNDNDGVVNTNDCSPLNKDISPNKQEICNNVDDDCDGTVDEGVTIAQYKDNDLDGYGNKNENPIPTCKEIAGYAPTNDDCDDTNSDVYPAAKEICDGLDNDCNGLADDGIKKTYYFDGDSDGFGSNTAILSCQPQEKDYVENNKDCDDKVNSVNPDAQEICNTYDDDCDGIINDNIKPVYVDCNLNGGKQKQICNNKGKWVNDGICSDSGVCTNGDTVLCQTSAKGECAFGMKTCNTDAWGQCITNKPKAEECNDKDDDCDGYIDEGLIKKGTECIPDNDYDLVPIEEDNCPITYNPQQTDYDKDGTGDLCDDDDDNDGAFDSKDCAQMDSKINPFAKETCNYKDDNCDDIVDEGFDFMTDNNNCGKCGWSCGEGKYCNEGDCTKLEGTCEKNTDCKEDENCVDNKCVLKEGCNYNNPSCNSGEICTDNVCVEELPPPPQLPDLYAKSIKLLQLKWESGNECKAVFEFIVENKGETDAENIKFVVETNTGQYLIGNKNPIPKIKKGKQALIFPPFKFSGTIQPVFYVDKENTVAELDETNNFLSYTTIECDYDSNGWEEGNGNAGYKEAKENGNADSNSKRSAKKSAADYSKSSLWKKVMDEREKMKRDKDDDVKYAYDTSKKKINQRKTENEKADQRKT